MIKVLGFDVLGTTKCEGIRYAWNNKRFKCYVESAAFINRSKLGSEDVCAYTTSVSSGCILKAQSCPCLFCRTGRVLPFGGLLSYKEIAKQNIFMVLSDMFCTDYPSLANKPREFAYMGQGEPGFSYSQVRLAIELTNRVMRDLGQTVFRHIFSSCGIPEAFAAYKNDIKNFFTERVTLHFSLHVTNDRSLLMPIDKIYSYRESINQLESVFNVTGEKICVGIMLFRKFKPKHNDLEYSTVVENVLPILDLLDSKKFRLSFCEFNPSEDLGTAELYPLEDAKELLEIAKERGFEAKLFSSFGQEKMSACGLLGGKKPDNLVSDKWKELDVYAEELIIKHNNI